MRPPLGILMLDTAFARPVGDAGNPDSWPFPVLIERVGGAHARPVVQGSFATIAPFKEAGQRLADRGAKAIITTCGFLVRHQDALQASLPVPVLTSTLTQYRRLQSAMRPGRRLAILTIDAGAIDTSVRTAAGIEGSALVFSPSAHSHFVSAILDAKEPLDVIRAEAEWVKLARRCQAAHPEISGWLFECANMPPYSAAVQRATGLPVYDALALGRELHAGLQT